MNAYTFMTYLVLLPGLIGSGAYIALHRPRRLWRTETLNADGWVAIVFLLYLLTIVLLIMRGHAASVGLADEIVSIAGRAVVDVLVVARVVSFLRFRRAYTATQREGLMADDGPDG